MIASLVAPALRQGGAPFATGSIGMRSHLIVELPAAPGSPLTTGTTQGPCSVSPDTSHAIAERMARRRVSSPRGR